MADDRNDDDLLNELRSLDSIAASPSMTEMPRSPVAPVTAVPGTDEIIGETMQQRQAEQKASNERGFFDSVGSAVVDWARKSWENDAFVNDLSRDLASVAGTVAGHTVLSPATTQTGKSFLEGQRGVASAFGRGMQTMGESVERRLDEGSTGQTVARSVAGYGKSMGDENDALLKNEFWRPSGPQRMADIRKEKFVSDLGDYAHSAFVKGMGSIVPIVAAGIASGGAVLPVLLPTMGIGEIRKAFDDNGVKPEDHEDVLYAAGIAHGALEYIPGFKQIMTAFSHEAKKEVSDHLIKSLVKGFAAGGVKEGTTEFLQTALELTAPVYAKTRSLADAYGVAHDDLLKGIESQMLESFVQGALAGGPFEGGSRALVRNRPEKKPEGPTVQPEGPDSATYLTEPDSKVRPGSSPQLRKDDQAPAKAATPDPYIDDVTKFVRTADPETAQKYGLMEQQVKREVAQATDVEALERAKEVQAWDGSTASATVDLDSTAEYDRAIRGGTARLAEIEQEIAALGPAIKGPAASRRRNLEAERDDLSETIDGLQRGRTRRAEIEAGQADLFAGEAAPEPATAQPVEQAPTVQPAQDSQPAATPAPAMASPAVPVAPANPQSQLASIIAGKTPAKSWAKQLGVTNAQMKPLLDAAAKQGLIRVDAKGAIRRTPKAKTAQAVQLPATAAQDQSTAVPAPTQPLTIDPSFRSLKRAESIERQTGTKLTEIAKDYAGMLEVASTDQASFTAVMTDIRKDRAVTKKVLDEIVTAYTGTAFKAKTKADAFVRLHGLFETRAEGVANAERGRLREPAREVPAPEQAGDGGGDGGGREPSRASEAEGPGSPGDAGGDGSPGASDGDAGRVAPGEDGSPGAGAAAGARADTERSDLQRVRAESEAKVAQERRDRAQSNYRISDEDQIGQGGPKAKVRANIEAIRILRVLDDERRTPTDTEKKALVKYVGWGAFAQDMFLDRKPEFEKERQQLKELLSPDEYEAARRSTQNAHYTSPEVVRGMWAALGHLGFTGGRVLEPSAGVGHFIGMIPESLVDKTEWSAVELDPTTGAIAKALYGGADVRVQGFETAKWPDGFFDLSISNVPFGNYPIRDPNYKRSYNIHDYFFIKALDKVRPGGIVAFITSSGTLDKQADAARRQVSDRATFLGAIRLPGGKKGAFAGNAGTDVTTDIIFLRKRMDGEPQGDLSWLELKQIKTKDGPTEINTYFAEHPEMMLGEMRLTGTRYGANEPVLIGSPVDIDQQVLAAATAGMEAGAFVARRPLEAMVTPPEIDTATDGIKEGAFYDKSGKIFRKVAGVGTEQRANAQDAKRIRAFMGLRDIVNLLLSKQARGDRTGLDDLRSSLNLAYDAFAREFGPVNKTVKTERKAKDGSTQYAIKRPNLAAFRDDPDAYKVAAIENYDEQKDTASKAAIFTTDVLAAYERPSISGPADAMAVSMNETGQIDMTRIAALMGVDEPTAIEALGERVYLNPKGDQWQTSDLYLSGDVVEKLDDAKAAAAADSRYVRNVAALEAVQPDPLTREDITVPFGAPWVPAEDYVSFLRQTMSVPRYFDITLKMNPVTKQWGFEGKVAWPDSARALYGTDHKSVSEIVLAAINSTPIRVTETFKDGDGSTKTIVLPEATQEAQTKVKAIREAWAGNSETGTEGWLWGDTERATRLEGLYNAQFNRLVPVRSDGSHLTFPGLASTLALPDGRTVPFKLRPHQANAVWRTVTQGNTLFDHSVGAGKTFTMIAAAMEQKRLGLIQRPMVAVPNHMLDQFSREWLQAYPNAKLLIADKESMSSDKRKEFAARVAADRWDGIIITHSAFGRVRMSDEAYQGFHREQLEELEDAIREESENGDRKSPTVKQLERMKESLRAKMEALTNKERKDDGITFEELGVDQIIIDEAHLFKNLQLVTRHNRVKGLATSAAQRSTDLFLKIQHLEKSRPGRSAIFATGTPVSNTMAEMYTMQRYLQLGTLKKYGIDKFDSWASTFGEITTDMELGTDGRSFQEVTSFSKFVNIPELVQIYSRVADTMTADMLKLPRPTLKGGAPIVVTAEPSAAEEAHMQTLIERADAIKKGQVKPDEDNMLAIMTEGRKVATDIRLLDPSEAANPDGKIAKAVENIHRIWKDGNDPALTQIVFLDMGVPGRARKTVDLGKFSGNAAEIQIEAIRKAIRDDGKDEAIVEENDAGNREDTDFFTGSFNLYDEITNQLVALGVPRNEIAYIHDAKTDEAKAKLFSRTRSGNVRVLIGSTGKMGVGTNVQTRLVAMHHIDAPWKPAEVEQRDGRILRQGNLNGEIEIYRYVTKRSLDAFMWQTLQRKANFIAQLRAGAKGIRTAEDIDNPLPEAAAIKAAASGDPRILEHAELSKEFKELEAAKRGMARSVGAARQALAETVRKIGLTEVSLARYEADAAKVTDTKGDAFAITLNGKVVKDRRKAADAIHALIWGVGSRIWSSQPTTDVLGEFSGMKVIVDIKRYNEGVGAQIRLGGEAEYGGESQWFGVGEKSDLIGITRRLENLLQDIPKLAIAARIALEGYQADISKLESQALGGAAFPRETRLQEVKERLAAIEAETKKPEDIAQAEAELRQLTAGASSAPGTPLFSLGGGLAATADLGALARAEEMDKAAPSVSDPAGYEAHRTNIWNETGWFRGVDGKWRFEIDDSTTTTRDIPEVSDIAELPDVLENEPLFEAYPSLRRMSFESLPPNSRFQGYHKWKMIGAKVDDDLVSTILHELQHELQDTEGFASGGNIKTASALKADEVRKQFLDQIKELHAEARRVSDLRDAALQQAREAMKTFDQSSGIFRRGKRSRALQSANENRTISAAHQRTVADLANQIEDRIDRMEAAIREAGAIGLTESGDVYRRLAGEVEARAVSARRDMTPQERAARPPWLDYDVPESEQIIITSDGADDAKMSIVGPIGAENLARQYRFTKARDALAMASDMDAKGATREDIWKATADLLKGTHFIAAYKLEGQWRLDVADTSLAVKIGDRGTAFGNDPVFDLVSHAVLPFAYPGVNVRANVGEGPLGGQFWRGDGKSAEMQIRGATEADRRMVAAHEASHLSQSREGFQSGGAIAAFADNPGARKKLAGEVEAIAQHERVDMTPAQRRARPIWLDFLVPESEFTPASAAKVGAASMAIRDEADKDASTGQSMRRDLDALGYYSKALEAARGLKQAKGTPEQMLAQLKSAGVKDAEIEATGLGEFLKGLGSTTALESNAITLPQNEGFDTSRVFYHGSFKTDAPLGKFQSPRRDGADYGVHLTPDRALAQTYAGKESSVGEYYVRAKNTLEVANLMQFPDGLGKRDVEYFAKEGYDSIFAKAENEFIVFNPDDVIEKSDRTASPPRRASLKQVTKSEIIKHLEENRVQVKEVTYGEETSDWVSSNAEIEALTPIADGIFPTRRRNEARARIESLLSRASSSVRYDRPTKWSRHSLDSSNPTYRETVLHLPEGATAKTSPEWKAFSAEMRAKHGTDDWHYYLEGEDSARRLALAGGNEDAQDFRQGHFSDVPNVIGHMMTSMTTHGGKPVFTVDQIQSDWGQKLRDGGVRDEEKIAELKKAFDIADNVWRSAASNLKPSAAYSLPEMIERNRLHAEWETAKASTPGNPLVNTTDQWVNTVIRRAIRQAAEAGADYIAIPSGATVESYNPQGDSEGNAIFYEKIVPKNLRNLLTKIDKASPAPERIETLDSPSGKTGLGKGFSLFKLTDAVKRSVMEEGQPLFRLAAESQIDKLGSVRPGYVERKFEIVADIESEISRMAPRDVAIRVADHLAQQDQGEPVGFYEHGSRLLAVSMAYGAKTAREGAWHEIVHALREAGAFTAAEWRSLLDRAAKIGIDERITISAPDGTSRPGLPEYANVYYQHARKLGMKDARDVRDFVVERLNQERVARMAQDWSSGTSYGAGIDALLARMVEIMRAIKAVLNKHGFNELAELFERAEVAGIRARMTNGMLRDRIASLTTPEQLDQRARVLALYVPAGQAVLEQWGGGPSFAFGTYQKPARKGERNPHVIMRRLTDRDGNPFLARLVEKDDDITVEMYGDRDGVAEDELPKGVSRLGRKLGYVDLNFMGVGHFATHGHRGPLYEVGMVEVEQDQRMRGLAKAAYNMIEEMLGTQMLPSGTLLPPGYEHWKKRNPDLVRGHQFHRGDEMYYSPKKIKEDLDSLEKQVKEFKLESRIADELRYESNHAKHVISIYSNALNISPELLGTGSKDEIAAALMAAPHLRAVVQDYYVREMIDRGNVAEAAGLLADDFILSRTPDRDVAKRRALQRKENLDTDLSIYRGMWRKVPKDLRTERARNAMFMFGSSVQRPVMQQPFSAAGMPGNVSIRTNNDGTELRTYSIGDGAASLVLNRDAIGRHEVASIRVSNEMLGRGIGSALFDAVERDLSTVVSPNGWLSDDAYRYWQKRNGESVAHHVNGGPMFDGAWIAPAQLDTMIAAMEAANETDRLQHLTELRRGIPPEVLAQSRMENEAADPDTLAVARDMDSNGSPEIEIFLATGWTKDGRGNWQFIGVEQAFADDDGGNGGGAAPQFMFDRGESRRMSRFRSPSTKTLDDLPGRISSGFLGRTPPSSGTFQLYHATNASFDKFNFGMSQDFGVHFGSAEQAGSRLSATRRISGGRTIPVEVTVSNAIAMPDPGYWGPGEVARMLEDKGYKISLDEQISFMQSAMAIERADALGSSAKEALRRAISEANELIRTKLNSLGIDGIWYRNDHEGSGWSLLVWNENSVRNIMTRDMMFMFGKGNDRKVKPITEIIANLKDAIGMTATQGLYGLTVEGVQTGKRTRTFRPTQYVWGQYDRLTGTQRYRLSADIDNVAHEGGHHIERLFGSDLEQIKVRHRAELEALSTQQGNQLSEGFANFFRDYILRPDHAQQMAPNFLTEFEDFLDGHGPEILEGIERLHLLQSRQEWQDYNRATDLERAHANLKSEADHSFTKRFSDFYESIGQSKTISGFAHSVYQAGVDQNHQWYRAVRSFLERADENMTTDDRGRAISLAVHENPYKLMRSIGDSFKTGLRWIQDGMPNYRDTSTRSPSLHDALSLAMGKQWSLGKHQSFGVYLESRRAAEEWKIWTAKQHKIADIAGKLSNIDTVRPALADMSRKLSDRVERLIARQIGDATLVQDRQRSATAAEKELADIGQRLDQLKDELAGAEMATAMNSDERQSLISRKQRQIAMWERKQADAVKRMESVTAERDEREIGEAAQGNMLEQLQAQAEDAANRLKGIDTYARELSAELADTKKNGMQRNPHAIGQAIHEQRIERLEGENPTFKDAAQMVYDFQWQQVLHDQQAGRLTQAEVDYRRTRKDWYVPFARDISDVDADVAGPAGAGIKRFSKDKRFLGSDRNVIHPIETIMDQTFHRAAATHYNEVILSLRALAERAGPGGSAIAEVVDQSEIVEATAAEFDRLRDHLVSLGYDAHDADEMIKRIEHDFTDTQLLLKWAPGSFGAKRPLLIPYWENGERKMIRINDPEFAAGVVETLNGIGKEMSSLMIDMIAKPATLLRMGVTTHPAFIATNILRDMVSAWTLTGSVMHPSTWPIITQARGLYHEVRQTDMARLYQEVAGLMGGQNVAALSAARDKVDVMALKAKGLQIKPLRMGLNMVVGSVAGGMMMGPAGAMAGAMVGAATHESGNPSKWFENLAHLSDMSETATRLGVFSQAYKAALVYNPALSSYEAAQEAAFVARDLIDFGRRGSRMLVAAKLVPFLNAQIQGLDKAQRTFLAMSDRGNELSSAKMGGAIAVAATAGTLVGGPIAGAIAGTVTPAILAQAAIRVDNVRELLAPFYKQQNGLPLSADSEKALATSAMAWTNLVLYTGVLLSFMALYQDDDEYRRINARIKNKAQPVKINGEWYQIPKAFELAIPSIFIEAAIDAQTKGDPNFWDRVNEGLWDSLSPPLIPQTVRMWRDIGANYNSLSKRPIISEYMQALPPQEQFGAYASHFAISLSRMVNESGAKKPVEKIGSAIFQNKFELTPAIIDYALQSGLGYWGKDVQKTSNVSRPNGPRTGNIIEYPLIGTMVQRFQLDPDRASDAHGAYHELMGKQGEGYIRAAKGYEHYLKLSLVDQNGRAQANAYLATLESDEARAYAVIEQQTSNRKKNAHPLNRARDMLRVIKDLQGDILTERLVDSSSRTEPVPIKLTPKQADSARDVLNTLAAIETENAMIALKHKQFATRKPRDPQPAIDLLAGISMELANQFDLRVSRGSVGSTIFQKVRIPDWKETVEGWPALRDEVLAGWREAGSERVSGSRRIRVK